jgi:AAA+ superfamily predicted ATPase
VFAADTKPKQTASAWFSVRNLADPSLQECWDRIILPDGFKQRLLNYLAVLAELSQRKVSLVGLALRRALLLYGPPGGGKTHLARGLANEWARRSGRRAALLLANVHAIPSGERGGTQKNVLTFFQRLREAADSGLPVFCVVDELETVAGCRASIDPRTNPQDTVYAVNAFIESLDRFAQECDNVVFLFTTNLPRLVDRAVSERVDFALEVPPPDGPSRRRILDDALAELKDLARQEPPGPAALAAWTDLLSLTEGHSGRDLRHLVVRALTFRDQPGDPLELAHLVAAASEHREQHHHHLRNGGIYVHDYQRDK